MPARYHLELSQEQVQELTETRDHHRLAYVRVKAAALLKVAQGQALGQVAKSGLLKPVDRHTIKEWIVRYQQEGVAGLQVQAGRGRKPVFSPAYDDVELAAADLQEILHHAPLLYGVPRSSWHLASIRQVVPWLSQVSLPGICKLLQRLHVCYRRGQAHVHSPDPLYDQKLAEITNARILAQSAPHEVVFLYEDEFTFFSRPLVGRCYQPQGGKGAPARGAALVTRRLAGCVDVASGALIVRQRDRFNVKEMYRFFYFVEKQYPQADVIYIALDNWPVHFHGYVSDHLAARNSRIRLLPLPTYAPWTNPMEKVWLKLSRQLLRQHPYGTDWPALKDAIASWFDDLHEGSAQLLHEIGLLPLVA